MGYKSDVDPVSFKRTFVPDPEKVIPVGFFQRGEPYLLFGLIPADIHLIAPTNPRDPMYLFGADRLGRDVLSRTIHGTRISMSIGLIGVSFSLVLGIILGGLSGFIGGTVDNLIQRLIEFLQSVPTIPLWMGLAAAIPQSWSPLQVYFAITIILSLIGWTGLAREVRGKFMALKHEDFVIAARLDGLGEIGDYPQAPRAVLPQPHHRLGDPRHPGDDPRRDGAELHRHRAQAAGGELGRAAAGGAEHPLGRLGTVAVPARLCDRDGGAVHELPRRRPHRCGGPLWQLIPRCSRSTG